jgi:hypothetical protein
MSYDHIFPGMALYHASAGQGRFKIIVFTDMWSHKNLLSAATLTLKPNLSNNPHSSFDFWLFNAIMPAQTRGQRRPQSPSARVEVHEFD